MKSTIGPLLAVLSLSAVFPSLSALAQKPQEPYVLKAPDTYASPPGKAPWTPAVVNRLRVPPGFNVSVYAEKLGSPRMLAVGNDGTLYVTRRDSGDVIALRDDGNGRALPLRKIATGMKGVHGIALHAGKMYLATIHEVYVADMNADGSISEPRAIITDLPEGAQHPNRTIGVGADGMLYISVGSTCNQCIETNPENATMLRAALDGTSRGIFARGLRNTIGWGWHPTTGQMWGMDHGTDWQGNDRPPEELNRLQGGHYGWPFCFAMKRIDSLYTEAPEGNTKEKFCPGTVAPTITYQAHSAPIQMVFYSASQFPTEYSGDAFVAMRGSWNRNPAVGYKVVRVRFNNGQATAIEDFLTGFLSDDRRWYHGRLAGLAVGRDGSLFVGDDTNGIIYRVTYGTGR